MYKNIILDITQRVGPNVSILVLMDLCIKTYRQNNYMGYLVKVSILVLMDLCIKTWNNSLNPPFAKSVVSILVLMDLCIKTRNIDIELILFFSVSILVLMDLCIKTWYGTYISRIVNGFNPCFNGSMYKNYVHFITSIFCFLVSILVLMDLCIKTAHNPIPYCNEFLFQSLF